ncbi:helix-turn-helix domain-containing protein, partial [Streptomyces olivochromogenes]|uniref:helix-turn-helix domain-containing protein n=1 Tax=Streptomyces olivochromogenes TaxID=1963 RepID=UPI001F466292
GDAESRASRRLSVFPDGFGPQAAAAVCAETGEEPEAVREMLRRLEARALLESVRQEDGSVRFRQPDPVRTHEVRRLTEADEADRAHDRLVDWLTPLAEPFYGPGLPPSAELSVIRRESGALRRALEWTLERHDDRAQALAPPLARLLLEDGRAEEARRLLERALAVPGPEHRYRASTAWAAAWHAFTEGDHAAALERALDAARMERALDRPARLILALGLAAACHVELGDPATGQVLGKEAFCLLATVEDDVEAWDQAALGVTEVLIYLGDEETAVSLLDAYRTRAAATGGERPVYSRERESMLAAQIALAQEEAPRAESILLAALHRNSGHLRRIWLVCGLAIVSAMRGNHFRTLLLAEMLERWCAATKIRAEQWWQRRLEKALAVSRAACGAEQALRARRLASQLTPEALSSWLAEGPARDTVPAPAVAAARLTGREREVVALLADGLTNYQMGRRLGISVRTVETHLDNIRKKTGLRTRAQIGIWAFVRLGADRADRADRVVAVVP